MDTDGTLVFILHSNQVDDYTEYILEVHHSGYTWKVNHRYSEFKSMHDAVRLKNPLVEKSLLPPKKIFGKMSPSFVDKRRAELETYLQTLLNLKFKHGLPLPLRKFLHFNLYDVEMICQSLSQKLYRIGDGILNSGSSYTFNTLELWAITERISMQKPSTDIENPSYDFGHLLDFVYNLKYLHVVCQRGNIGSSNIKAEELMFDIAIFRSLAQLVTDGCSSDQAKSLVKLHRSLTSISVHNSLSTIKSVLTGGYDRVDLDLEWKSLVTADFSDNDITHIDDSVKLMVCVEFLDLSRNKISKIENLNFLASLTFIDLSHNLITEFKCAHAKMGNVKTLILANNKLSSLHGLEKLYSLENLNVSDNLITELNEVDYVSRLPCILKLNLSNNALVTEVDYRTKVLSKFGGRACEICLDETPSNQKELDTAAVLHAILKSHRSSTSGSTPTGSYEAEKSSPIQIQRKKVQETPVSSAPGRFYATPEVVGARKQLTDGESGSQPSEHGNTSPEKLSAVEDDAKYKGERSKLPKVDEDASLMTREDELHTANESTTSLTVAKNSVASLPIVKDSVISSCRVEALSVPQNDDLYLFRADAEEDSPLQVVTDEKAEMACSDTLVQSLSDASDGAESFNEKTFHSSGDVETVYALNAETSALESTSQDGGCSVEDSKLVSDEEEEAIFQTKALETASIMIRSHPYESLELSDASEIDSLSAEDETEELVEFQGSQTSADHNAESQLGEKAFDVHKSDHDSCHDAPAFNVIDLGKCSSLEKSDSAQEEADVQHSLNFISCETGDVDSNKLGGNFDANSSASVGDEVENNTTASLSAKAEITSVSVLNPLLDVDGIGQLSHENIMVEVEKAALMDDIISGESAINEYEEPKPDLANGCEDSDLKRDAPIAVYVDDNLELNGISGDNEGFKPEETQSKLMFCLESPSHESQNGNTEADGKTHEQNLAQIELSSSNESLQLTFETDNENAQNQLNFDILVPDYTPLKTRGGGGQYETDRILSEILANPKNENLRLHGSWENFPRVCNNTAERTNMLRTYSLGARTTRSDPILKNTRKGGKNMQTSVKDPRFKIKDVDLKIEPVMNLRFSSFPLRHLTNLTPLEMKKLTLSQMQNEEQLCYVTWSSVVFYEQPYQEIPCVIFLSNQALYFAPDDGSKSMTKTSFTFAHFKDSLLLDETTIARFPLSELVQIVVGLAGQHVRVTGSSPAYTATLVTRSSSLSKGFINQFLATLEEPNRVFQDVKKLLELTEKLEDLSVLLRCGVRITLENEQAMMEFNLTTLEVQKFKENLSNESRFILYLLVLLEGENLLKSFLLTKECCCLCDENVVSYPLPEFETKPPMQPRFCDLQFCSLADVTSIELDGIIGYNVVIKSPSVNWRLLFRDYSERNKLIRALCEQYELLRGNSLPIHCAI